MQVEYLTNAESIIGMNHSKTENIDMKSRKNKKQYKNALKNKNASGGIPTREYNPIFTYWYKIYKYFFQAITDAIQQLAQRPLRTAGNYQNFTREVSWSF